MLDLFPRVIIAALAATAAAPLLGCFLVQRRLSYFNDALAHSTIAGVLLAAAAGFPPELGALLAASLAALAVFAAQRRYAVGPDAALAAVSYSAVAIAAVAVAVSPWSAARLSAVLFGDPLAVSWLDAAIAAVASAVALTLVLPVRRLLILSSVNHDMARVASKHAALAEILYLAALAVATAAAVKTLGALLAGSCFILPAAAARLLSTSPDRSFILASAVGAGGLLGGFLIAFRLDLPPAAPATLLFTAVLLAAALASFLKRSA